MNLPVHTGGKMISCIQKVILKCTFYPDYVLLSDILQLSAAPESCLCTAAMAT